MKKDRKKPVRSWQEIAEEASHERNRRKLDALSKELDQSLTERDKRLKTKNNKKSA